jgi:hypothetical protein
VAYLLGPGSHICRLVNGVEGPGVALLPLGGKVRNISTTVSGVQGACGRHGIHCIHSIHCIHVIILLWCNSTLPSP